MVLFISDRFNWALYFDSTDYVNLLQDSVMQMTSRDVRAGLGRWSISSLPWTSFYGDTLNIMFTVQKHKQLMN